MEETTATHKMGARLKFLSLGQTSQYFTGNVSKDADQQRPYVYKRDLGGKRQEDWMPKKPCYA